MRGGQPGLRAAQPGPFRYLPRGEEPVSVFRPHTPAFVLVCDQQPQDVWFDLCEGVRNAGDFLGHLLPSTPSHFPGQQEGLSLLLPASASALKLTLPEPPRGAGGSLAPLTVGAAGWKPWPPHPRISRAPAGLVCPVGVH